MYRRPAIALRTENMVAELQCSWMVNGVAAGRGEKSALGMRVVGSGSAVSPWCASGVRRLEMPQHEM